MENIELRICDEDWNRLIYIFTFYKKLLLEDYHKADTDGKQRLTPALHLCDRMLFVVMNPHMIYEEYYQYKDLAELLKLGEDK